MTKTKTTMPRFVEIVLRFGLVSKKADALSALFALKATCSDKLVSTRCQQLTSSQTGQPTQPYLEYRDVEAVLAQMTPQELAELRKRVKTQL